tara:strand:+ start:1396 stop:3267 length:1872 start_codon:yes stop_codon:yes gene_type:complete
MAVTLDEPIYNVTLPGSPDVKGTITFQQMGPKKRATIEVSGIMANGAPVALEYSEVNSDGNIGFTGAYSFANFDVLAQEIIYNVSNNITGIGGGGVLEKTLQNLESEVIPNNGEEEVPVYIVRSSIPNGGPRGQITFEFRESEGQREIGAIGEIFRDTYNTEEFSLPNLGESSVNYDYKNLADNIINNWNSQIPELSGGLDEFGVLSIVETQTQPPQNFYNYTIIGKVIDGGSLEPLENVIITDDVKSVGLIGSNTYSEPTGEFILMGEYQKEKTFSLSFSLEGYTTKDNYSPFQNIDGDILSLKKDIGIIELNTSIVSKKSTIAEAPLEDIQIKTIQLSEKLKDPQGFFIDAFLQKLVKQLKTQMLPFVLQQLVAFGITNAAEAIKKSPNELNIVCPANLEALNIAIEQKNKLTKQLNNLFNALNTIKDGVSFANQIITVSEVVFQTLSALILAFPNIPFAPDPTKFFTSKLPPLQNQSVQEVITRVIAALKILTASTELILNILIQLLQKLLSYLALLDGAIQKCALDGALSQESLDIDLLATTQEQANQGSSIITNVNGFEMAVMSVDGTTQDQLKRRKAVARNQAGVIMLQGEPSFSSNDQILIDELVFYIQQNNLKAD